MIYSEHILFVISYVTPSFQQKKAIMPRILLLSFSRHINCSDKNCCTSWLTVADITATPWCYNSGR